ncbi:MAG TPA: tetratricopeptide repeat protein [Longimicrobiales bacterium]|nr:tetratricopeptide repeat protein [Longimicrobiales bacterium]
MKGYTTREVAEVLGLPTSRILAWTRSGLLTPERGTGGTYLYSFQDIVLLRAARELLDSAVPARRVKAAIEALRAQLPVGRPLSAVHISAAGDRVFVRDEDRVWEPDSGQLQMEFAVPPVAELAAPVALRALSEAPRQSAETDASELAGDGDAHAHTADDWYNMALDLEAGATPEAVAAYRRALELDPEHPDAHLNLGRLLHEDGKLAEAEAHYRAAAAADAEGARAHYNLGVVLEDQRREAQAVAAYRKALSLDGNLATAHFNLSRLLESRGNEAGALSHLSAYKRLLGRDETGT